MKVQTRRALALGLLTAAAIPGGAVFAQTAGAQPAATNAVGEVVVTARRREEALADVPVTVDVVTATEMFERRQDDLKDLANTLPNVYFASDLGTRARVSIRGVGPDFTGQQGPGVGFYIDGVYQNSTASLNVPFFDLERVEVLKGPQGTLYGRNTLGGVINYITPRPNNAFSASVQGEAGNFDTYRVAGAVSGPIVRDKLYGRLSVQHAESDGPWRYAATGKPLAPTQFDGVRGRLIYDATDQLNFDFSASAFKFDAIALPFSNVADLQHLVKRFVVNPPNTSSNNSYQLNLGATYDFGGFQALSRTAYYRGEIDYAVDSDLGPAQLLNGVSTDDGHSFSQELRLQSTGDGPFQWMVAGSYVKDNRRVAVYQEGAFIDLVFQAPGSRYLIEVRPTAEVWSAFTDLTYRPIPRLELGAGLRYDAVDLAADSTTTFVLGAFQAPLGAVDQALKQKIWQPKFTARYEISDDLSAFATAAKGFRQGGFNPLSVGTPFATYSGDILWSYETGLKWRGAERRASANISAFYIDLERATGSAILPSANGTPNSGVASLGSARSYGVEAQAQYLLTPELTLDASGGLQNCEYRKPSATAPAAIRKGGKCVDSSKWNFRAQVSYERPLNGSSTNFFATGSVQGRGPTRIGLDVTDSDFRQVQKAYYLVGASAGLKGRGWQAFAFVDNLFDERYATTIFTKESVAAFGAQEDAVILGQPRTYGVRVRFDY